MKRGPYNAVGFAGDARTGQLRTRVAVITAAAAHSGPT
jgi:hypothetical protein